MVFEQFFIFWWTGLRIGAVFFLWIHPLAGYIVNILLDAVDGDILERLKIKRDWYEQWDKALDLWFYCALAAYILLHIPASTIKTILLSLFAFRLLGSFLFTISNKEWFLFLFPNVFSELFVIWLLFPKLADWEYLLPAPFAFIAVLFVFSLFKEWWIHIAKIDISDMLTGKKKKWR